MQINIDGERYISVGEVEQLVGQKSSTIDVKVRYGAFPKPIKLPVVKFWKLSEIESYLSKSGKSAESPAAVSAVSPGKSFVEQHGMTPLELVFKREREEREREEQERKDLEKRRNN